MDLEGEGVFKNNPMNCATKDIKSILSCFSISGRSVVSMSADHAFHVALIVPSTALRVLVLLGLRECGHGYRV